MEKPHLLIHDKADNVGVVVIEDLPANTDMLCVITEDNSQIRLKVTQEVTIGHKVALTDLKVGDTIIKYSQDIGKVVQDTAKGEHIHVHNVKTKRW